MNARAFPASYRANGISTDGQDFLGEGKPERAPAADTQKLPTCRYFLHQALDGWS
jgi:hypothetical protein